MYFSHSLFLLNSARLLLSSAYPTPHLTLNTLLHVSENSHVTVLCRSGVGNLHWHTRSGQDIEVSHELEPTINRYQWPDVSNREQILVIQMFREEQDADLYTCTSDLIVQNMSIMPASLYITSCKYGEINTKLVDINLPYPLYVRS